MTSDLEDEFAEYVGTIYAVAVNGTGEALLRALKALNVNGGNVCVSSFCMPETLAVVAAAGAKPVFVDLDPLTLTLDLADLNQKITDSTKAIIADHFGGHACDLDAVIATADSHGGTPVVENCANAAGGTYKGRRLGSFGAMGCFNGIITGQEPSYEKVLRSLEVENQFQNLSPDSETVSAPATIEAAIVSRRKVAAQYDEAFKSLEWLEIFPEQRYAKDVSTRYAVRLSAEKTSLDDFQGHLEKNGVASEIQQMPKGWSEESRTPVAQKLSREIVYLPIYSFMPEAEALQVIKAVTGYISQKALS